MYQIKVVLCLINFVTYGEDPDENRVKKRKVIRHRLEF